MFPKESFLDFGFVYLTDRMTGQESDRDLASTGLLSRCSQQPGQGQKTRPHLGLPPGWQRSRYVSRHRLPASVHVAKEAEGKEN